jgi:hypothetical protein
MIICAICMCANGTIVTNIFVGSVSLAIVVYNHYLIQGIIYNTYQTLLVKMHDVASSTH